MTDLCELRSKPVPTIQYLPRPKRRGVTVDVLVGLQREVDSSYGPRKVWWGAFWLCVVLGVGAVVVDLMWRLV